MSIAGPDGLTGALMAAEGVSDMTVILHGPGGCRFRYMRLAEELYGRNRNGDEEKDVPYYFGRPRMPCTYLDESEYIGGGYGRICDALRTVSEKESGPIAVVCSPAAALIGDNIAKAIDETGLTGRAFTVDFNPVSVPMSEGFDRMMVSILKNTGFGHRETEKDTVNLLGVPILCNDWEHTVSELARLLGSMGLRVISSPGAGSGSDVLRDSARAEFSIPVFPEFCIATAEYYRETCGISCAETVSAPIGLDATEEWILRAAELTGKDPSVPLAEIAETRRRFRRILLSDEVRARRVKGKTFSMRGQMSEVLPLTKWLYEYLSMVPVSVKADGRTGSGALEDYLGEIGFPEAFGKDIAEADCILASGDYSEMCRTDGWCSVSVDLGFPPSRKFLFRTHTLAGVEGAENIMERIFNQVRGGRGRVPNPVQMPVSESIFSELTTAVLHTSLS